MSNWSICTAFVDRIYATKFYLESLKNLNIDRSQFEIIWLDLSKNPEIRKLLNEFKENFEADFISIKIFDEIDKSNHLGEDLTDNRTDWDDTYKRRKAVASTMKFLNEVRNQENDVIIWEDDISVETNAFNKLSPFLIFPILENVVAITCPQYARDRDGNNFGGRILVWRVEENNVFGPNDSCQEGGLKFLRVKEGTGIQSIDASATGFFLINGEFLKGHDYMNYDFENGQDVMLGYAIKKSGKKLLINWEVHAEHMGISNGEITIWK